MRKCVNGIIIEMTEEEITLLEERLAQQATSEPAPTIEKLQEQIASLQAQIADLQEKASENQNGKEQVSQT